MDYLIGITGIAIYAVVFQSGFNYFSENPISYAGALGLTLVYAIIINKLEKEDT